MSAPQPESVGESRAYWTHNVKPYPHPVAQLRMSQLVDYDPRLTEPARTVYRFLVGWYMDEHGDALASVRKIVAAMRGRAPDGAKHLSRSAVQRAIIHLIDNNWLTRKELGKGRRGSRYVPVANVLELAAMGRLPDSVPVERDTKDEFSVPVEWDTCVPVERDTTADSVPVERDKDTTTRPGYQDPGTCSDIYPPVAGGPLAAAPDEGFDRLVSAYDKPGDDLRKARQAFDGIAPDAAELDRMVRSAEGWKRTARGARMALARWLTEKRWLSGEEWANDNRKATRHPACLITGAWRRKGGGAKVNYRDYNGDKSQFVLDADELEELISYAGDDQPRAAAAAGEDGDLSKLIGARFHIDDEDGTFAGYLAHGRAAA